MTTNIDPATVPAWPAPEVRLTGQGLVEVDGVSLRLPQGLDGADARRWAVQHVASKYARLGRPIRVTAIETDGARIPLIVHPDGTVQAVPEETPARRGLRLPAPAPRKGSTNPGEKPEAAGKSQARGLIAVAVFLGAIALIGVVILNIAGGDPAQAPNTRTRATASGPATPPPANLPRPAPEGWTTRAAWSLPVSADVSPAVAPNGTVATVTDKGELAVLDPATGITRWTAELPDGAYGALVFTRIDGRAVLALSSGQTLHYWPLDGSRHPHTTVDLPSSGGTVTFAGDSPLVALDEATAGVISKGQVRTVDLPAKATALAANGTTVLAANGAGHIWSLTPGQKDLGKGQQLAPPANGARLNRVVGIDGRRLAGVWQNGSTIIATAYDAHTGKPLAAAKAGQDADTSTMRVTGDLVAIGPLLLNTADGSGRYVTGTTPKAAAGGRIYAIDQQQRTHALAAGTDTVIGGDDVALPLGVAAGRALVVADKLGQRTLYALTPGTGGQQPLPGSSGQVDPPQPPGQGQ
ncbi:PQQ-binding-like beta-propeller repeat protein [Streptomyces sp. VTCC 41912]|uniref:outer membrane protein assembly factor BamB family protein n=1 Tax=Streptomyces sp. VTCC 41912 TaxID=3383243 RepID=UPI003896B228